MSTHYQYVTIMGRFFCLQQNPLLLAWFLYLNSKSLQLHSGLTKKDLVNTLKSVKGLIKHQLRLRNQGQVINLPFYGHLCLPVHRGYKLFNFKQKTVTKIFAAGINIGTVKSEIERVRTASIFDFAPNVWRWDVSKRWYEEEFTRGYPCYSILKSDTVSYFKIFQQYAAPCLEQMILLEPPRVTNLTAPIHETLGIMQNNLYSKSELNSKKVDSVKDFVETMAERLRVEENAKIYIAFSHGDFSLLNILKINSGIKVIDWESAGWRSVLCDLYNYFFTELYFKRATTRNIITEVDEAISSLQSRLKRKVPDVALEIVSLSRIYLRLYYIERIGMLLDRELDDWQLDVILRSIEVFNCYEELLERS